MNRKMKLSDSLEAKPMQFFLLVNTMPEMKYILLFTLLFLNTEFFAQEKTTISGSVKTESGESIPFANVVELKGAFGAASDINGHFTLDINQHNPDTCFVEVSAIGYRDKVISVSRLRTKNTVSLQKVPLELVEVDITAKRRFKKHILKPWKGCKLCSGQFARTPGEQTGMYFKNEFGRAVKISHIKVGIMKYGIPECPLRLRIYKRDSATGLPSGDLLQESVIDNSTTGGGWLTFDLADKEIFLPADGAIIAVEWIYAGEHFYHQNTRYADKSGRKYYGPVVRMAIIKQQNLVVGYNFHKVWYKYDERSEFEVGPAIKVKVLE